MIWNCWVELEHEEREVSPSKLYPVYLCSIMIACPGSDILDSQTETLVYAQAPTHTALLAQHFTSLWPRWNRLHILIITGQIDIYIFAQLPRLISHLILITIINLTNARCFPPCLIVTYAACNCGVKWAAILDVSRRFCSWEALTSGNDGYSVKFFFFHFFIALQF